MKKIISIIVLIIVLGVATIILTGCTLQIETTDNSVSASVDGDTTERVDSVLDWIKERLSRLFNTSDGNQTETTESSSSSSI